MKNFFLPALTKGLNSYLALDPESKNRLQQLQGKVITFELLPLHFTFQCLFNEDKAILQNDETLASDAKIIGTPLQMLGAMMMQDKHSFFADDLQISGDAELAKKVVDLFDHLSIDWDEQAAKFIGDIPAHHAGELLRSIKKNFERIGEKFTADINEFTHEEVEWFPTREALHDFFNDIDALRMDVDRMEARINQITDSLNHKESL